MKFLTPALFLMITLIACKQKSDTASASDKPTLAQYFEFRDTGVQSAGIKMVPIKTLVGNFRVWTKRFGNNPRIKVLLLHGGPAMTHEYMECFESFFPKEGFEFYEYDQLGSYYSDQPTTAVCGRSIILWMKWNRCGSPWVSIKIISSCWEIPGVEYWEWNTR